MGKKKHCLIDDSSLKHNTVKNIEKLDPAILFYTRQTVYLTRFPLKSIGLGKELTSGCTAFA
jgi:hypothetical protein